MNTNITVEVCVENLAGARAAVEAGVPRIELCGALDLGGVTPDAALLESVLALPIETVVLIRPRAGDFVYDTDDSELMVRSIELARAQGASSFAIGALLPNGSIDQATISKLVEGATKKDDSSHATQTPRANSGSGNTICFHRAFDGARDPIGSLQVLANLGITRLLTSGQQQDALAGAPLIKQLVEAAPPSLAIMPGGGVRPHTLGQILSTTGAQSIHFSARTEVPGAMQHTNATCDLHDPNQQQLKRTTASEIQRYLAEL